MLRTWCTKRPTMNVNLSVKLCAELISSKATMGATLKGPTIQRQLEHWSVLFQSGKKAAAEIGLRLQERSISAQLKSATVCKNHSACIGTNKVTIFILIVLLCIICNMVVNQTAAFYPRYKSVRLRSDTCLPICSGVRPRSQGGPMVA